MLVLTIPKDKTFMIGDDVEVMIVNVGGKKAKVGIKAPKEIPVHRRKIYDAIQREKTEQKSNKN